VAVTIVGRQFWLWHSVDDECEVFDLLVQRQRDKAAAMKLCASGSRNKASRPMR
jgi:transposase-like protein